MDRRRVVRLVDFGELNTQKLILRELPENVGKLGSGSNSLKALYDAEICQHALACDILPLWEELHEDFYPELPPLEQAVTIAIGFKCSDGIVLATDTQYTRGAMKSQGPKMFPIIGNGRKDFGVVIAGAGNVAFMKRASEKIQEALEPSISPTMNEVRVTIERTLKEFYRDHVYPNPKFNDLGLGFHLLIGAWTGSDGFEIFKATSTTLERIPEYGCIGAGVYVSEYAVDLIFDPDFGLTVDEAKFVAAFSIKAAKDYVNSCGGSTKIYNISLDESGLCRIIPTSEVSIKFREEQSVAVYESIKLLLKAMDADGQTADDNVAIFTDNIKDVMLSFRKRQREQKERFLKRKELARQRLQQSV